MGLKVIHSGIFDTLQDQGRYQHQHLGINPGGFMDTCAASIANFLVGNSAGQPALELHFPASEFVVQKPCILALSGADFRATINGHPLPINQTLIAGKGCLINFNKAGNMVRTYLAIHGGFNGETWLNSAATNLKITKGGIQGRNLKNGDLLSSDREYLKYRIPPENTFIISDIRVYSFTFYKNPNMIRVLPSLETDGLEDGSKPDLFNGAFEITRSSDRMGYRLKGPGIYLKKNVRQKYSSAVVKGTMQLLPSGEIVILMSDHQSTGGYPMIGNILAADLPKLAQKKPGDTINFVFQNLTDAEKAFEKHLKNLEQIQDYCMEKIKNEYYEGN